MRQRVFLATFDNPTELLAAVRTARARGLKILDVYAPYPVHGLSAALGLPASRLSRVCFVLGAVGAAGMTYFQFWTSAISWPVNIGGKPWNSWPAFVPPIFETMVLAAAVGTAIAFAVVCGLRPGREPAPLPPGATDRCFVLALEPGDGASDQTEVRELFAPFGVRHVDEQPRELG